MTARSAPDGAPLLSCAELQRLLASRRLGSGLVVLDARGSAAYRRATHRVEGDRRLTRRDLDRVARQLPSDSWAVAYCTCQGDGLALRLANELRQRGVQRAAAVAGGLDGCREAGLPIVPLGERRPEGSARRTDG